LLYKLNNEIATFAVKGFVVDLWHLVKWEVELKSGSRNIISATYEDT
jgi:hypothetical protein